MEASPIRFRASLRRLPSPLFRPAFFDRPCGHSFENGGWLHESFRRAWLGEFSMNEPSFSVNEAGGGGRWQVAGAQRAGAQISVCCDLQPSRVDFVPLSRERMVHG